jgi:uncharacterized 2Fe-2S/4Fe-4S cluster protein (DUF4445 family)
MNRSVRFLPSNIEVQVAEGTTILDAAFRAGVEINSVCGGKGVCGRCKVLVEGDVKCPGTDKLSHAEKARGYRLACLAKVAGDLVVLVPDESGLHELQILESFRGRDVEEISPLSKAIYRDVSPPTLDNNLGDRERLEAALGLGEGCLHVSLALLRQMSADARDSKWHLTSVLDKSESRPKLIALNAFDTSERNFGIAMDIGTTTVVMALVDLNTGKVLAQASDYNKQIMCGEDILARIAFAEDGGMRRLNRLLLETINSLVAQVVVQGDVCVPKSKRVCREEITALAVAGNTTMVHLFLGLHPKGIRYAPYVSTTNIPSSYKARDLTVHIHPNAPVYCVPGRASYVGGDIVADVLCSGMAEKKETSLLIDVGTNGEVVLGNDDFLVACSCSAGPAFEGGEVKAGVRAMQGAIEKVEISRDLQLKCSTIGGQVPRGICGSGLIDLVASLYRRGIVDRRGTIQDMPWNRVRQTENGREFVVAFAEETKRKLSTEARARSGVWDAVENGSGDIAVNDDDIANIIRTKAALYAACEVLLDSVHMEMSEVEKVYIAGGFGNHIDLANAISIGLLPDLPHGRFEFLGNASLGGARLTLLSSEMRRKALLVHKRMTYLELTTDNRFFDRFTSASFLPHTDMDKFPTVKEHLSRGD